MSTKLMLETGSKWIMVGDSISDCDRARPYGEGLFEGIGRSYVGMVDALLKVHYSKEKIRVINMGCGGDTSADLLKRWKSDVLDLRPDWVSILIGANDVWRQFDSPLLVEQHVTVEEYEHNVKQMIEQTLPMVNGILLITPYYMEPNRKDKMRARMDMYGDVIRKLSSEYNLPYVNLQEAFDVALQEGHANKFSWDRIHPNQAGHMLIATTILNAIGFEWNK